MNKNIFQKNNKISRLKIGFTITELAVVVAIVTVISAISVISFNEYTDKLWLRAVSQEVALMFREAQTKAVNVSADNTFLGRFGVYISRDGSLNNIATSFIDSSPVDGKYNATPAGCSGECQKNVMFQRNIYVKDICTRTVGNPGIDCGKNSMSAVYIRPEPDARMAFDSNSVDNQIDSIIVKIGMPENNLIANINIGATGYVSINYTEDGI